LLLEQLFLNRYLILYVCPKANAMMTFLLYANRVVFNDTKTYAIYKPKSIGTCSTCSASCACENDCYEDGDVFCVYKIESLDPLVGSEVISSDWPTVCPYFDDTGRWLAIIHPSYLDYSKTIVMFYDLQDNARMVHIAHDKRFYCMRNNTAYTFECDDINYPVKQVAYDFITRTSTVTNLWGELKPWTGYDSNCSTYVLDTVLQGSVKQLMFKRFNSWNWYENPTNELRRLLRLTNGPVGFDELQQRMAVLVKPWSPMRHRLQVVAGSLADRTVIMLMWVKNRTAVILPNELWLLIIELMFCSTNQHQQAG